VDLERAATEHRASLGPAARFESAPRSEVLGARCLAVRTILGTSVAGRTMFAWLVLLEPDTEGRLAGYLARHGEGWAATWLASSSTGTTRTARPGPFGLERLMSERPLQGPFRLGLVAATIES
jgi:hypothetical protein